MNWETVVTELQGSVALVEAPRGREMIALAEVLWTAPLDSLPLEQFIWFIEQLEAGIWALTVEKAMERSIERSWEAEMFIEQYSRISYTLKVNIDPRSSVNADSTQLLAAKIVAAVAAYFESDRTTFDWVATGLPCAPAMLARASPNDLNPHINRRYLEDLHLRSRQGTIKKYSTRYPCPKCKVAQATLHEQQVRRGDESGTLFIECLNCSWTWRIS